MSEISLTTSDKQLSNKIELLNRIIASKSQGELQNNLSNTDKKIKTREIYE